MPLPTTRRVGLLFASVVCVAVVAVACDREATADSAETSPTPDASVEPPGHEAPSLDELRTQHEFAAPEEGAPCQTDRECLSPLRCFDATCIFPPAMTGDSSATSVTATFDGARLQGVTYHLELADESWEVTRGLMHRFSMVDDMGMIFDFGSEAPRRFWMRNTFIPLDMVFVRTDGTIDSIVENAEPQTDTGRESDGPARFVIELNAGEAARIGLEAGSTVALEGLPE